MTNGHPAGLGQAQALHPVDLPRRPLPRMDGFEALRRIKSDPALADLRVVMLTAKAQDADIFRGWSGGVDGYLTKPFNPMDLLAWARRILAAEHGTALSPGRIQL